MLKNIRVNPRTITGQSLLSDKQDAMQSPRQFMWWGVDVVVSPEAVAAFAVKMADLLLELPLNEEMRYFIRGYQYRLITGEFKFVSLPAKVLKEGDPFDKVTPLVIHAVEACMAMTASTRPITQYSVETVARKVKAATGYGERVDAIMALLCG